MCGIFGVISDKPVGDALYHGTIQLQHRGQDSAGVFVYDDKTGEHAIRKDRGLATQVLTPENMPLPGGNWGIAHLRYTTIGVGNPCDIQPQHVDGSPVVAMAHNGNIVNYIPLRDELIEEDEIKTSCDVEVLLKLFANSLPAKKCTFDDVCKAATVVYDKVPGAYSIIALIAGVGMVAFRDPYGIRPLLHGMQPDSKTHAFASETEALSFLGFVDIHSIAPGELVFVDKHRRVHRRVLNRRTHAHCSFEFVYFAKPNTIMEQREVYNVRTRLGLTLAKRIKNARIDADIVIPIPDSARPAAIGCARGLDVPYEEGFVKKDHVGRTFIMATQEAREKAMSRKIATVSSVFRGKRIILVDDSIVRGTVSKKVIRLARLAGAKTITFASSFPPIRHPCFYGIDFPSQDDLIGWGRTPKEIAHAVDADAVIYNDVADLKGAIGMDNVCTACLTGCYPIETAAVSDLQKHRTDELIKLENSCKK